ncbi:MAG: hypothetical protein PWQ97_445 [Tepidanaerobacteraceae bacterium]|nr:hypothetical protein [Tepidanaerobacteraceae bacterium]
MLPNAYINIEDGALGIMPSSNSGLHFKVGVASKGNVNEIYSFTSSAIDTIKKNFGTGPLVNALFDSFSAGSSTIYAVKANADIPGTISVISSTKTGTGNMTATGSPLDEYHVEVEIITGGLLNQATFRYSLDGVNWSQERTIPVDGKYDIPDTGISITFTESQEDPANSFKAGDKYMFSTQAPQASVNSLMAAVDVILNSKYSYSFIHVVGESDVSVWAALAQKAQLAETNFNYIHFICEVGPNADETADQYTTRLTGYRESFANTRISVSAAFGVVVDMNSGLQAQRNFAALYAGRLSSIPVHRSPGRVRDGAISGVIKLLPEDINDGHIETLNDNGYITFRQFKGLDGFYITDGKMMANAGSDFTTVEHRRTMDEACTLVRSKMLEYTNDELPETLEELEADLSQPLRNMKNDGNIRGGTVYIPKDQDVLSTQKLIVKVRIVPVPIMKVLEAEIAFENPYSEEATA